MNHQWKTAREKKKLVKLIHNFKNSCARIISTCRRVERAQALKTLRPMAIIGAILWKTKMYTDYQSQTNTQSLMLWYSVRKSMEKRHETSFGR
jgi:hypothetical protein